MKIFVSTVPFAKKNVVPIGLLHSVGCEIVINPLNRKLSADELAKYIVDVDYLIAGTEEINKKVLESGNKLKLISRVGIGLDGIDLNYAKHRGIKVSYTPDAPSSAVSELTICLMLSLLRSVHLANYEMHQGNWTRYFGRRISDTKIGLIGHGRIGSRVADALYGLGANRLMANDINPERSIGGDSRTIFCSKERIYSECDLISIHVPLTRDTLNMIGARELSTMKENSFLINTSRGGIINELDLYNCLLKGGIMGAAIDVFESEPYSGPLSNINSCLLTSHMGSMSFDCRAQMEIEATQEVIRDINGETLINLVPDSSYDF